MRKTKPLERKTEVYTRGFKEQSIIKWDSMYFSRRAGHETNDGSQGHKLGIGLKIHAPP